MIDIGNAILLATVIMLVGALNIVDSIVMQIILFGLIIWASYFIIKKSKE